MISTIMLYSTNEFRFLEANLKQLSKFSDEIIITICSHFFSGDPENEELLKTSLDIISKYNKCIVKIFEWENLDKKPRYYHNLSRKIGTSIAKNEWLFFVDADEIPDNNFKDWFDTVKHTENAYVLTCSWYFRQPIYRAKSNETNGLVVLKKDCNWDLDSNLEREQIYQKLWDENRIFHGDISPVLGLDGEVLIHHYSWVRSKEQMIKKVKNWSHKYDRDWVSLVEEEFSRDFNGTDFVHNYSYEIVENKFKI
jgi:hypothetical protein